MKRDRVTKMMMTTEAEAATKVIKSVDNDAVKCRLVDKNKINTLNLKRFYISNCCVWLWVIVAILI